MHSSTPTGLRRSFTPREWQAPMIDHAMHRQRWGLWASMGSGKTSAVLMVLERQRMLDVDMPALIVAPKRVARDTWPDEVEKWVELSDMKIERIIGTPEQRLAAVRSALRHKSDVYTVNYENLPWLVEQLGAKWPFKTVISDESTKLKGFRLRQGSSRAKALAKVSWTLVNRFGELTGTPAPNGLKDLWGQAWFLDKGAALCSTYTAFIGRWFNKSFDGHSLEPQSGADKHIYNALGDLYLTIDLKDYVDLREPIENTIQVMLPDSAMAYYRRMEKEMFLEIDDTEVEAFNAASMTVKCLQISNGALYTDAAGTWSHVHDAKLEALDEVIEEANGAPVLVAYQFKSDLERLRKAYPHGKLLSDAKDMQAFKTGKYPVAFGHPASMGHGVDGLQYACNIVVFFGHWWNLEERMQMIERVGPARQMQAGLDRPTYIYNIVATDTLDEDVLERHAGKLSVQDALLNAKKKRGLK